ncbi:permease, putative [Roseobacter sp. SK209-2-6]|uniref:permease n=1 Tax=Roseobacter sp. SK209-2-6 TaxID=388739 RepID=UPI0000F3FD6D|nr:permease [Roseobacter sp. SK209-2-6]EBA14300.1 permease, putative [Roseobacter sp. SK209-2-6]
MTNITDPLSRHRTVLWQFFSDQRIWVISGAILAVLALVDPGQAGDSAEFAVSALLRVAPYLVFSIAVAAWAGATGADNLVAKAFTGAPLMMILLGAIAGGLSPFCSCGVIPLIAALLAMGVPLSAVMAFWLASPIMDPSMFFLTTGVLGVEFAIAKTISAVGLGVFGGTVTHLLGKGGALIDPLREGVGNGGCGGAKVRAPKEVVWRFWQEAERRSAFLKTAWTTTLFLAKWLFFAFLLESLMLAWIPAETVTKALGGTGILPIVTATLVGVPAYLNGYAALPLVGGLIEQGMAPGAGLAFLVAGGVTSIPAAMAVWALAKPKVFALYLGLSLSGAFATGLLFQLWHMI